MITAAEIRKQMKDSATLVMADIEVAIKKAADNGAYKTTVPLRNGFDYDIVVAMLANLGYHTKIKKDAGDWREQGYSYLEINWSE